MEFWALTKKCDVFSKGQIELRFPFLQCWAKHEKFFIECLESRWWWCHTWHREEKSWAGIPREYLYDGPTSGMLRWPVVLVSRGGKSNYSAVLNRAHWPPTQLFAKWPTLTGLFPLCHSLALTGPDLMIVHGHPNLDQLSPTLGLLGR